MGKVRVKTLGIEEQEKQEKKETLRKAEGKRQRKEANKTVKAPGLKGGERVIAVGPSEEELAQLEAQEMPKEVKQEEPQKKKKSELKIKKRIRSKRYIFAQKMFEKSKIYPLFDAIDFLEKFKKTSFDETVELHINALEPISGNVTLPHGTGKKTRVVTADSEDPKKLDELVKKIESGKIDFDILIATPTAMAKLAKVARVLGPRGLMPNPKNGTVTDKPQELMKKFEGGQVQFKSEAKFPILHLTVGKVSFGKKKLEDNIKTFFSAIPSTKIRTVTLKSTMSPGIKIQV